MRDRDVVPVGTLNPGRLRTRAEDIDGMPALVVDDGDTAVEFVADRDLDRAVAGLERLAGRRCRAGARAARPGPPVTSLGAGDGELHDPDDPTLHVWTPPWLPDEQRDREWIARVEAHVRAHSAACRFESDIGTSSTLSG